MPLGNSSLKRNLNYSITSGWSFNYFRKHSISVFVSTNNLKFVFCVGAKIVDLYFASIWRIYRQLDPVWKFRILFTISDEKSLININNFNTLGPATFKFSVVFKLCCNVVGRHYLPDFVFLPTNCTTAVSRHPFDGNCKRFWMCYRYISWCVWSCSLN